MNTELVVVKGKVIEQSKSFTAEVGEDIGYEAGAKMIKRYFDQNNDDVLAFFLGRNIIESILAQPGVAGIRMFNAINDNGIRQLVLVGADNKGNNILQYTAINTEGQLEKKKGIVADRAKVCPPICGDSDTGGEDLSWY